MSFVDRIRALAKARANRVPDVALHPEGWVQYDIRSNFEVELTGPGSTVDAIYSSRHRRLGPGVVTAAVGTVGIVAGLMADAVMVRLPRDAVRVVEADLKPLELRDWNTPDPEGRVLAGFLKPAVVPLTDAEEQENRQWSGRWGQRTRSERSERSERSDVWLKPGARILRVSKHTHSMNAEMSARLQRAGYDAVQDPTGVTVLNPRATEVRS